MKLTKYKHMASKYAKAITQRVFKYTFILMGKTPVKKNYVVFESFLGKQYSDNPRAIYEYMLEHYPNYQLYWSVDRKFDQPFKDHQVKILKRFSLKWALIMPRAKYWVINARLPLWLPKPNHTTYLQTWHGTPLKRLALDMDEVHMPATDTKSYKENFVRSTSKWDLLISPNHYSTNIFKRAFQFNKRIVESGYPRNDYLVVNNNKQSILTLKQKNKIPLNKKVLLYAPTWRDNQFFGKGRYSFKINMDLDLLQKELDDDYIVIIRMHYLIAEQLNLEKYEEFIYDFSSHEDIRELYLISDVLITDYSSVFFDYANLKRPMIFYVYDIDNYRDQLRGFYFDLEKKAPGPLVKTTDKLIDKIKVLTTEEFNYDETFYQEFCALEDGKATERILANLLEND